MNVNELESVLYALSKQRPKAPAGLTENMVKTARRLEAERLRKAPAHEEAAREISLSSEKPQKDKHRSM